MIELVIAIVIILALFGFVVLLFPDTSYWLMSSVMTQEQIESGNVTIPLGTEATTINVIPILPFVIIGFILIIMLVVVSRR